MKLRCQHNQELNLEDLSVSCKECGLITINNGKKLATLFKGSNEALRRLLNDLMAAAEEIVVVNENSHKRHFRVVPDPYGKILQDNEQRAFFSILRALDNPPVILYDEARRLCFVFNPLVENQRWNFLRSDDGQMKSGLQIKTGLKPQTQSLMVSWRHDPTEVEIPVELVIPWRQGQSRKEGSEGFTRESLELLGESILLLGQLFPAVVRKIAGGKYEIIVGERRWRATKLIGKATVRAIILVAETPDNVAKKIMALENANRVGLTDMEIALQAYGMLFGDFWSMEEVSGLLGTTSAKISRLLPLCELQEEVQKIMIRTPEWLSVAQGLKLATLKDPAKQIFAAKEWAQGKEESRNRHGRVKPSPGAAARRNDDEPQQGSGATYSGFRRRPGKLGGNILSLVPEAERKDGLSAEEGEFREMVKKLLSELPGFSQMVGMAADRHTYTMKYLATPKGRERINFLLGQLAGLCSRAERLQTLVNRYTAGQPPLPDSDDISPPMDNHEFQI